jgi:diacylglycerol O-acyltransferase 2, plant
VLLGNAGYEPHSVFPNGMPVVFSEYSKLLPAGLKGITGLASSTVRLMLSVASLRNLDVSQLEPALNFLTGGLQCFHVPIIRHLWWGLGLRPATRTVMSQILESGQSVVICPGGVRECCHLSYDKEVIFLRQRYVRTHTIAPAWFLNVRCFITHCIQFWSMCFVSECSSKKALTSITTAK